MIASKPHNLYLIQDNHTILIPILCIFRAFLPYQSWAIKKFSLSRFAPGSKPKPNPEKDAHKISSLPEPVLSEKIPIKYGSRKNEDKRYYHNVIYDSYKPQNLREMQDYIKFITIQRKIIPCDEKIKKTFSQTPEDLLNSPDISPEIKRYYEIPLDTKLPSQIDQEKVLVFDSNFESGNLDRACIVSLNEYNLFLNVDTNTRGHAQWFFFSVTNAEPGRTVSFNILNLMKMIPLYKMGMRPLAFSEVEFEKNGIGWTPDTFNVNFGKTVPSSILQTQDDLQQNLITASGNNFILSFSYTFKHSSDRVYFASQKPYTCTMLNRLLGIIKQNLINQAKQITQLEQNGLQKRMKEFIKEFSTNPKKSDEIDEKEARRRKLAQLNEEQLKLVGSAQKRIIQQPFPENTITDIEIIKEYALKELVLDLPGAQKEDYQIETDSFIFRKETLSYTLSGYPIDIITITGFNTPRHPIRRRKIIFISARVHAAEVGGSYKMEGILKYLTANHANAEILRNLYIFKIVPILNPEGVLCGNYRCTFTGTDLNRRWDFPDEYLHSQIYYLKYLLRKLSSEGKKILVFCDLHGHARKLNSFMYGCNKVANGSFCSWTKVRLLPRILARKSPLFSYSDCKFVVETDKQRTARVVIWKELNVTNSFTLESSCYGYNRGTDVKPFTDFDYFSIGEVFLDSLVEYHYVLKSIENELVITKGWLKPSKLIELTGTPAAVVLARKLAQEKEESKKKMRMSKLKKMLETKRDKTSIFLICNLFKNRKTKIITFTKRIE